MKKLPRTEFQVMKYIWSRCDGRVALMDITNFMNDEDGWSKGTTSKTLLRLVDKGFVRSEKDGRQTFYYPTVDSKRYLKFETKKFFSFIHNNSLSSIISSLDDTSDISKEDIEILEEWLKCRE